MGASLDPGGSDEENLVQDLSDSEPEKVVVKDVDLISDDDAPAPSAKSKKESKKDRDKALKKRAKELQKATPAGMEVPANIEFDPTTVQKTIKKKKKDKKKKK